MGEKDVKLTPFRDWSKPAQDRLIDDAIRHLEKLPATDRDVRMQGLEWQISALKCREFYLCVAVVVAFLIGLLGGMWFQSLVKRLS